MFFDMFFLGNRIMGLLFFPLKSYFRSFQRNSLTFSVKLHMSFSELMPVQTICVKRYKVSVEFPNNPN